MTRFEPVKLVLTVLGVALILEGVPWFLSPGGVRQLLARMVTLSDRSLRFLALLMMMAGLLLVNAGTG